MRRRVGQEGTEGRGGREGPEEGDGAGRPPAGAGDGGGAAELEGEARAPLRVALETVGAVGSVALAEGPEIIGQVFLEERGQHQRLLVPALDRLLDGSGREREELTGVVVGAGPGSFTGVRIAAAAGKAIAHALRVPMWAVSSLAGAAVAERVLEADPDLWPGTPDAEPPGGAWGERPRYVLFDARGDRVYGACYRWTAERLEVLVPPAGTRLGSVLEGSVPQGSLFVGDAALRHRDRIRDAGYGVLAAPAGMPSAAGILRVLALEGAPSPLEDPGRWEPDYLRASSAERERVG